MHIHQNNNYNPVLYLPLILQRAHVKQQLSKKSTFLSIYSFVVKL
jgi:hypothetical protein